MVYLVAELHRRLGNFDLAREWYEKALARSDLNPQHRQWVPEQIQLMNGPEKQYPLCFQSWRSQCCSHFLAGSAASFSC